MPPAAAVASVDPVTQGEFRGHKENCDERHGHIDTALEKGAEKMNALATKLDTMHGYLRGAAVVLGIFAFITCCAAVYTAARADARAAAAPERTVNVQLALPPGMALVPQAAAATIQRDTGSASTVAR